jgi:transposase
VSVWHARWQHGGTEALRSRGPSGPAPRLSDAQLTAIEQALLQGATANGFTGELWTLDRIATVIQRLTGIRHHPAGYGRCCTTGWAGSCSGPSVALPNAPKRRSSGG